MFQSDRLCNPYEYFVNTQRIMLHNFWKWWQLAISPSVVSTLALQVLWDLVTFCTSLKMKNSCIWLWTPILNNGREKHERLQCYFYENIVLIHHVHRFCFLWPSLYVLLFWLHWPTFPWSALLFDLHVNLSKAGHRDSNWCFQGQCSNEETSKWGSSQDALGAGHWLGTM